MDRKRFLFGLGVGALTPVTNKVIPPEPEIVEKEVEKIVVQDKLLQWNPDGVYYNPSVGRYVKIVEVDDDQDS